MKVGIVGLQYRQAAMGGVEKYLQQVLRSGESFGPSDRLTMFGGPGNRGALSRMEGKFVFRDIVPTAPQLLRRAVIYSVRKISGRYYLGQLEDRIRFDDVDILHFPFSVILPDPIRSSKTKIVVTIHDIQHVEHPEFFAANEILYREKEYRRAAREADLVLTDSEYSRKMILSHFGTDPGRVVVYAPGIDVDYYSHPDDPATEDYLQRMGIAGEYLLYPASPWPHKNHHGLLMALKNITINGSFKGSLVLCGVFESFGKHLQKLISEAELADYVKVLGYVSTNELRLLYHGAKALVYPSLYEGFGFPILEAMASGTPVICSKNTSLTEVGETAVRYIDPNDIDSICRGILEIWNDEHARSKYRTLGMAHVKKYDLREASRNLHRIYLSLHEGRSQY